MDRNAKLKTEWAAKLQPLVGRQIVGVRYLDDKETRMMCIGKAPVALQLDDGALLWPMADDEGNDGGALFIQPGKLTKSLPEGGAPTI